MTGKQHDKLTARIDKLEYTHTLTSALKDAGRLWQYQAFIKQLHAQHREAEYHRKHRLFLSCMHRIRTDPDVEKLVFSYEEKQLLRTFFTTQV